MERFLRTFRLQFLRDIFIQHDLTTMKELYQLSNEEIKELFPKIGDRVKFREALKVFDRKTDFLKKMRNVAAEPVKDVIDITDEEYEEIEDDENYVDNCKDSNIKPCNSTTVGKGDQQPCLVYSKETSTSEDVKNEVQQSTNSDESQEKVISL